MRGNRLVTLAALGLLACETPGTRVAGTSTSVGTSVGGTALTKAGTPAAGARVTLRTDDLVWRDGKPEGRLLAETTADGQGRFTFRVPEERFQLRISCDRSCGADAEGQTWMAAFDGAPGRALDGVRLAPPGTITGVLAPTEGTTDTSLWIGIPGTDIYRKPGPAESGGRPFTLPDVPAGAYFLESLTARDPGQGSRYKTEPIQVRSGETIDLGGFP